MRPPVLEKLLILQDRDQQRLALEAQLKAVPADVERVQQKISAEKSAIETARTEVRELETKKKLLETEIGSAEDKLAKYRTQQLQVRKNEEYQALGHEIETTKTAIEGLEEKELGIMFNIDEAKKRFVAAEAVLKTNIAGHEARLKTLAEREANLRAELDTARAAVAAARPAVDDLSLRLYDRVSARQMPACVPVRGGNCGGCHLKLSSENDAVARKGEKLATCDQCGRIVWFES
ncbi:MAG TPA: C4-type zinc ribbon domain-containing protein [Opitutaceae bacterium]